MAANHPKPSAKNETGDFAKFTDFMQRPVAVPIRRSKPNQTPRSKRSRGRNLPPRASCAKD
jgi:hypothetical protein